MARSVEGPAEDDVGSAAMARPVQGGVEHVSERTLECVSERAEATTREWPVRAGADVTGTFI
jgi:hypothetical protein